MGFMAYGRKVAEAADHVRYAFGVDEDDPEAGVLVIPVGEPDQWFVEGREDRPKSAVVVASKAHRLREETGEWPDWASVFS